MQVVEKKNIVYLASYPKSGNTWFRAFLTALLSEGQAVDINNLWINHSFSDAVLFEQFCDQNASELLAEERDLLKPEVQRYLAKQHQENVYVKIHERYHYLKNQYAIIPNECTKVVLYFIRNPLDVVVSFAHHSGWSFDKTIQRMRENWVLSRIQYGAELFNLPEQLGSWSEHVSSWVNNVNTPVELIRYEDMQLTPLVSFQRAVAALDLHYTTADIARAIEDVSFEKLQEQEKRNNFKEKNSKTQQFFRKGKIGSWQEELTNSQIQTVIKDHQNMMQRFGYL